MADYADLLDDKKQPNQSYLVLDIGGGTVDVTALMNTSDGYEIIIPPLGNDFGGMKVNENFRKFLETIVDDKDFSHFLFQRPSFFSSSRDKKTRDDNKAALSQIINHDFEKLKLVFGDRANYPLSSQQGEKSRLLLERKFATFYKDKIKKGVKKFHPGVVFLPETCTLEIQHTVMAEFFEPVLGRIKECVLKALTSIKIQDINAVLIAGGFGGCKYVFEFLKSVIHEQYRHRQERLVFLVPKHHTLAVAQGAIHYCRHPDIITARTMDATYGLSVAIPFVEGKHKEQYAAFDDDNQKMCNRIFKPYVYKGEKVKVSDVYSGTLTPFYSNHESETFSFYCSTNPNVLYHTDKNTEKIGELTMDTPNPNNIPKNERIMKVTMSFSSTEITAVSKALYLDGQPHVNTVLDFLTK